MQAAVAHEVPNQFGELSVDGLWYIQTTITGIVGLIQHRQRNIPRLSHENSELHRHDVTFGNIGEPLPLPVSRLWADHLDPMRQRPLNPIPPLGYDSAGRFLTIDKKLRRLPGAVIGRDLRVKFLPTVAINIT